MKRLRLRARIIEKYGTIGSFADYVGTNYQTIANVLSGEVTPRGFSRLGWLASLDIPENEEKNFFAECLEITA